MLIVRELEVTAFIYFFCSGDGVFEVDAYFIITVFDIVRIVLILFHFIIVLDIHPLVNLFLPIIVLVFIQLDIDLIIVHDPLRVLMLIFVSFVALLVRRRAATFARHAMLIHLVAILVIQVL